MPQPVGLLLVHGIGRQRPGDTLDGFLGGMRLAYGERLLVDRREPGHAVLDGIGRTVHAYEVYWADLLQGDVSRDTFDKDRLREWAWFPRLYANDDPAARRSERLFALADSFGLAVAAALLSAGILGARLVAALVYGGAEAVRDAARGASPRTGDHRRTPFDVVLDEVVGDVSNYVHGITGAFPAAEPGKAGQARQRQTAIAASVAAVQPRLVAAVRRAHVDGCDELQVLAHSLGTVVAFRGLSLRGAGPDLARGARVLRLTRFHTFGSPIEKFRVFWWRVLDGCELGSGVVDDGTLLAEAADGMHWDNFYSPFDLVSGPIAPWAGWPAARNHRAPGLGGLVSAHVAYHGNPRFVASVGEALTGLRPRIETPWVRRVTGRLRAIVESLLAPAVLLGLSLLGFVTLVGFAWLVGVAVSWPLARMGLPTAATIVEYYVPASILFVMTVGDVILGHSAARELHARYWARRR
jgi:hypothetical protein